MKTNNIRFITFVALISILILQGVWLYSTYKLIEVEFNKNVSDLLITSLEKEVISRMEDPNKKELREGKTVEGVRPEYDRYTNNKAFQDFLQKEQDPVPISLDKLDSIFNVERKKSYNNKLDYSFLLTDSVGNKINFLSRGTNHNKLFAYKETIQLRNIAPEYITLVITSPYRIIFGKMLLLLIGSFVVAILVGYGLIMQVRIINKQNKVAKLRQDFSHAMIHDMKNPVTSIITGVATLRSGKMDDKPQMKEHFYNIITQESERMLQLSNKVLEIAHFEGEQINLNKEVINLPEMLENLKERQSVKAAKKVHFHFNLNDVETVYADRHYIYEAFDNLIDNAVKYSKENEDVDITITGSRKDNETQLIFKDQGIGISEKDQKVIFKKFERAEAVINSKKKISGFGLGLNFVYQAIKAHGGTVRVNSRLGSYSEFIINIPNS